MEAIRTVKVKLDVPDQRRDDLHQTADQFRYCANQTSEWAWRDSSNEYCVTSKAKAEDALYARLRDQTDLTANLVQKGIRRAIEAVKSGVEAWKRGDRTTQPHFDAWSIVYDKRSATADYNASKNIARKLAKRLRSGQTSPSGGATYQLALASWTLSLNGDFHASDRVWAEGESTDKPHPQRARSSDRAK